ncbi:MAG: hypothetical protein KC493_00325 [Bacteriovoracaceae bacterium]|nr:hypothetical protein [Bacteriovoracaceae bacterium]
MSKIIQIFVLCLFLSSCSGYQVKNSENPLSIYGINSLAIPVFINHTPISKVSGPLTDEIKSLMMSYMDLGVQSEYTHKSDAVLLGIIESPRHLKDTSKVTATKFTTGDIANSIGTRNEFFIPSRNQIDLRLRLILIKSPNKLDLEVAKGKFGKYLHGHPRVIFQESLDVSAAFTREISGNLGPDSGGVVNFTKNKRSQQEAIKAASKTVATTFKQEVLDAF